MADTKKIELSKGVYTVIDYADWGKVKKLKLYAAVVSSKNKELVAQYSFKKNGKQTTEKLHRFLLDCPKEMVVVHLDGNRLNNTRANLVMCKRSAAKEIRKKIVNPKNQKKRRTYLKSVA